MAVTTQEHLPGLRSRARGRRPTAAGGEVTRVVRTCALLRCPFTSLPIAEAVQGQPALDDLSGYARRKAAFVRGVLDACR